MGQREGSDPFFLPLSPTTTIHATGPIYLVDANLGQQLFRLHRRPLRRARLQATLAACLVLVGVLSVFQPRWHDALASALLRARGGAPPPLLARDLDFPVQSCCIGQQCVDNSKGRHAVVTLVRSQREVTQLQASCPRAAAATLVPASSPPTGILADLCPARSCFHSIIRRCCKLQQPQSLTAPPLTQLPARSNWRPACGATTRAWTWR